MSDPERDDQTRLCASWLRTEGVRALMTALACDGATPRFVGGCVRNALLEAGPTDLDVAIDVVPDETLRLLEQADLRAIPTGLEHGTITTLVDLDGEDHPIEITSLRRDVETDGRHAVVAFTTDWVEDAERRDFSMNALYADGEGRVFDPLGVGLADLRAGRVRFIGLAEDRIHEDYLRILRYFRFFAWYGRAVLDGQDLDATRRLSGGLAGLARERVGAEMRKLLAAPRVSEAIGFMAETNVLSATAPALRSDAAEMLAALERVEARRALPPDWRRRLAAIAEPPTAETAAELTEALRLSNADRQSLAAIFAAATVPLHEAAYRRGVDAATQASAIVAARDPSNDPEDWRARVQLGADARLPIAAADLIAAGVQPGPGLGGALKAAEAHWIHHEFALDRDALLAEALKNV